VAVVVVLAKLVGLVNRDLILIQVLVVLQLTVQTGFNLHKLEQYTVRKITLDGA
jgi:hypothetical protein